MLSIRSPPASPTPDISFKYWCFSRAFLFMPCELPDIFALGDGYHFQHPAECQRSRSLSQEDISRSTIVMRADVYRNQSLHSQATSTFLQFSLSRPEPASERPPQSEPIPSSHEASRFEIPSGLVDNTRRPSILDGVSPEYEL